MSQKPTKRTKKAETKPEPPACKAIALIRKWMEAEGLNTNQLARKLDRTWICAHNILTGKMRPDIDAVTFFQEKASVPIGAWMEAGK